MIYRARQRQTSYGQPIGILVLEEHIPCPPGTPGNPTTFTHPIIYETVRGASTSTLRDPTHGGGLEPFLAAAQALVDRGACALAGNCGLMIVHQEKLARALPIPVFLSSLLQLPLMGQLFGPDCRIGILASSQHSLTPEHLRMAGASAGLRTVIGSMEGKSAFNAAVVEESGVLDFDRVQAEVVEVALTIAKNPDVAALLFECVDLPPYAAAVQEAVGLPIFDMTTLIAHAFAGMVRRPFRGVY